jgi:hypothetical protein
MHPDPRAGVPQQSRVRRRADQGDAFAFFNLLTSPELLDTVESLRPGHRERLFPPTETLSMFRSRVWSADRSRQPRAIKRRPKPFALLTRPRAPARVEAREHGHPRKVK